MIVRKIPNFSIYTIDTDGKVFNLKTQKNICHLNKTNGYIAVWLRNDLGVRKNMLLHRVLMLTFFPDNAENYPCVDHIDRNKQNNKLSNLRYATYSQNALNRSKCSHNQLGKNIFKYPTRYRVVIYKEGQRLYDKSFLKKNYNIDMVKSHRNKVLLENNLLIFD